MPKIIPPRVAPQLQDPKSRQKTKSVTLTREQVMLYQNEAQRPQYISSK
jgi:hypothetical protein